VGSQCRWLPLAVHSDVKEIKCDLESKAKEILVRFLVYLFGGSEV
jgi:hypothetical protein